MHHLPEGLYFVLDGYYYHLESDELLSLKSGVLRPIKRRDIWLKGNPKNRRIGWQVSHLGKSKVLLRDSLIERCERNQSLLVSVIPIMR